MEIDYDDCIECRRKNTRLVAIMGINDVDNVGTARNKMKVKVKGNRDKNKRGK